MKSCAPSVSMRRLPISGSSLSSWIRCWSRVESAMSTRAACQFLAACSKLGKADSFQLRSGTRFAASSPAIHCLRSSASRFVGNEPP